MRAKATVNLEKINQQLRQFASVVNGDQPTRPVSEEEPLRVGVDLGTSSIVLTVLDAKNQILYGDFEYDTAVRDGVVVNFMDSVTILSRLKQRAEEVLGVELTTAAGAIPPGTGRGSAKIVANVIESAGFICRKVVDEPTAAAKFLRLKTGTVVDIGGGTTGISIFENGHLTEVLDEATGGFHMTLVLAGNQHVDSQTAEKWKRDQVIEDKIYPIIRPVVEKMATIVKTATTKKIQQPVIVVGGAINFSAFIETFSQTLGMPAFKPENPQFVTPLGIAMYDQEV